MKTRLENGKVKVVKESSTSLKGTMVSVLLLLGFILFTWFAVFAIFLDRL